MDLRTRAGWLKKGPWIGLGVLLVVALLLVIGNKIDFGSGIDKNGYQMVTLTSGERFIGKLSGLNERYVTLDSVYHQQSQREGETTGPNEVVVVRYSGSVAKPEDSIRISSDKIIHWENLQEDSKIVQAIRQDNTQ